VDRQKDKQKAELTLQCSNACVVAFSTALPSLVVPNATGVVYMLYTGELGR